MEPDETYGGWVTDPSPSTGGSRTLVHAIGWVAMLGAVLMVAGTGEEWTLERLRDPGMVLVAEIPAATVGPRTPREDLSRILKVLDPAITNLATALGVSRQAIYKWDKGEVAPENASKLRDLAEAADILDSAGVKVDAALIKRRFASGKTLLQVVQSGGSAREAALLLIQITGMEAEQRARMDILFRGRGRRADSGDFDLPEADARDLG